MADTDTLNDPGAAVKRADILNRANVNATLLGTPAAGAPAVSPGKALALTADNRVVDSTDPDAAFVLCGATGSIPKALADELGIKPDKSKKADTAPDPVGGGVTIINQAPV